MQPLSHSTFCDFRSIISSGPSQHSRYMARSGKTWLFPFPKRRATSPITSRSTQGSSRCQSSLFTYSVSGQPLAAHSRPLILTAVSVLCVHLVMCWYQFEVVGMNERLVSDGFWSKDQYCVNCCWLIEMSLSYVQPVSRYLLLPLLVHVHGAVLILGVHLNVCHFSNCLLCLSAFSLDTELPDYDLDSEDETFVNKLKKKMEISALQFEEMIDRLEKGSGQQVCHHKGEVFALYCICIINYYTSVLPACWKKQNRLFFNVKGSFIFFIPQLVSLQEAKLLLKEDDELIKEVFDYWSRKRKICKSSLLIPVVKQEKRDGSSTSDPYVAFRRRTEKMQTRKVSVRCFKKLQLVSEFSPVVWLTTMYTTQNRKNDEVSYEKMLKLRRDLSRAVTILEMIKRREKSKRELLHLTLEIVEKR